MKSYKISYSSEAKAILEEIETLIAADSPRIALAFIDELENKIELLSSFPDLGAPDSTNGLFFIYHKPYYIYHSVDHNNQTVNIISIWHGARAFYNLK